MRVRKLLASVIRLEKIRTDENFLLLKRKRVYCEILEVTYLDSSEFDITFDESPFPMLVL